MTIKQLIDVIIQNVPGLGETQAKLELFETETQFAEETDILRRTAIVSASEGSLKWTYPERILRVLDIEFYDYAVRRLKDHYYKRYDDDGIFWEYLPGVDTVRIKYSHLPKVYQAEDKHLETPDRFHTGLVEKVCSKHYRRMERLKEAQFSLIEYRDAVLRAKKEVNKWVDQTNSGVRPHYY
jgi:hypothetical protein